MIHYATAETAEDIARLLRSRGRIVVTAPPRSGKTTELLKYAEERYPNGRFAVIIAKEEDQKRIIKLHWRLYNGISHVEVVAKRLLGQELEGEDVMTPVVVTMKGIYVVSPSCPIFVDEINLLPEPAQRAIFKRRLFIAATTS
jgi:thymidine kinase